MSSRIFKGGFTIAFVVWIAALVLWHVFAPSNTFWLGLVTVLTLAAAGWIIVKLLKSLKNLEETASTHAGRVQKEQAQERQLAAADERSRIAREMHDIVAHSLQVIITQADGASYVAKNSPELAEKTLTTISKTARESLKEMRRLIGILRVDEPVEMGTAPDLSSIADLVQELEGSGIMVTFSETGQVKLREKLPQGAELAAYRFVQEALTNVIKHGGPDVEVVAALEWEPEALMLSVIDNGRGAGADPAPAGSGHGIRGMRERLALYGGTVVAQPKIGGGFAVHGSIPYSERS